MQIQVTTITSETMQSIGTDFSITTFEQTTSVFCDCCNSQASGTKDELKQDGWMFWNGSEFCPMCN